MPDADASPIEADALTADDGDGALPQDSGGPGDTGTSDAGGDGHPETGSADAADETDSMLFSEDFEQLPAGVNWADDSVHGAWHAVFSGYGTLGIETDATQVLMQSPQPSTAPGETHASLAVTSAAFGDAVLEVRVKTVAQLRTPAPNDWEVGWVLWRYTDPLHFYYFAAKPGGWELGKEDPAYPGAQRFDSPGSHGFCVPPAPCSDPGQAPGMQSPVHA